MAEMERVSMGWWMRVAVLSAVGVALAGGPLPASAVAGPPMGTARSFGVLGGEMVTSTGMTSVSGNVGVWPGTAITGFPPGVVTEGEIHAGDATAMTAHNDAEIAYLFLAGMAAGANLSDTDLGGLTLAPGVYKFDAAAGLTGDLVLDAQGDSGALFVFQVGTALTTATGSSVRVINGGKDYNEGRVFWQIGSSATLGTGTEFTGHIVALTSITLVTDSSLTGNALALNGAVSLDTNAVVVSPPLGTGDAHGKPSKGSSELSPPGGPDTSFGVIDVRHTPAKNSKPARSWLSMKVHDLDASTEYTLWADDPATAAPTLVQFDSLTTKKNGRSTYTQDTMKGGAMPFGATLAALSGEEIEVRDSDGEVTLLEGIIPTTSP